MPSPDSNSDAALEAELRAVPLPAGLLVRLRHAVLADDAGLDAAVREVPVPAGLLSSLRSIALADDAGLDEAIRDVPVPRQMAERLQRGPKRRMRARPVTAWSTAGSLWLAIGLSLSGALFLALVTVWRWSDAPDLPLPGPRPEVAGQPEDSQLELSALAALASAAESEGSAIIGPAVPVPEVDLAGADAASAGTLAGAVDLFPGWQAGKGLDLLLDATPYSWPSVLGSGDVDALPELRTVPGPAPRGIKPPLVPGFDLDFYLRYGVHPFVRPAAHPKLQTSIVPLGVDTSSYDLTRRYLEGRELPRPSAVRTEEYLAAVCTEFPEPKRQPVGLSVAAGPSPFGGEGLTLLQIGVQGRRIRDDKHPPVHLVLVVDTSASMRWGGRLEAVQRALRKLVPHLGPDDRVSLLGFSEQADVLIEEAGPNDADALREAVAWLAPQKSTNVGAGLRRAYTIAQHLAAAGKSPVRVVLLTDGTAVMDQGAADLVKERLAEALDRNIRLDVIELGQSSEIDPQFAGFAQSAGGRTCRAASADQICWALLEGMTGKSQLIARDVGLKVTFNPKTVLEYRLLGHEASAIAGLMPDHPEADFFAGQSATALYEVRLTPTGGQDVATVELTWQPLGEGTRQQTTRTVRRKEFAAALVQSPASLQAAALVAETAEILRGVRAVRAPHTFGHVLELARGVHSELSRQPAFAEFVLMLQQAEKAKPYRSGVRK